MSLGDPYVELVEHLSRVWWDRHEPAAVAQVTLVFWAQYRDTFVDLDNPALVEEIGAVLSRMPASRHRRARRAADVAAPGRSPRYGGTAARGSRSAPAPAAAQAATRHRA